MIINNKELHRPDRIQELITVAREALATKNPIAPDEQIDLFKALHAAKAEKLEALQLEIVGRLYISNVALVYKMCQRFRLIFVEPEELIAEGRLALFLCIRTFNPWRGLRFSTYACSGIIRHLSGYCQRLKRGWLAVETAIGEAASMSPQPDRGLGFVSCLLNHLTCRERFVIGERFLHGLEGKPPSLETLGGFLNLSIEGVRNVQLNALRKLRNVLRIMELGPEDF